ncbi:MAG: FAD:protein FMN transferase [Gammaproteobacteria bacterium]|nr:FAD:protein FMN transferase [Gammaproteobacteria bacterium]
MKPIDAEIEQLALQEHTWREDSDLMELNQWMIDDFVDLFAGNGRDQSQLDEQFAH